MQDKTNKLHVTYFFRNREVGFSMHRVFEPIANAMKAESVKCISAPYHRATPLCIIKNMLWAFKNRERHKNGVNHITGDLHYLALPLAGCNTVLTIHDLVTLRLKGNWLKKMLWKKLWFEWPLKCATKIVCISETTRRELLTAFPWLNKKRVQVIYNPVNPHYTPSAGTFNKSCPTVLHIGTGWNKNLQRVILALNGIPCHLVIIGALSEELTNMLAENKINYTCKTNISDEEMLHCYHTCDIVSFPSLFEGFGMPIIEGQAVARAVLTSCLDPMREIAGKGACLVNPSSVEEIHAALCRIIEDGQFREACITYGLLNVKRFDVNEIAAQYKELYLK